MRRNGSWIVLDSLANEGRLADSSRIFQFIDHLRSGRRAIVLVDKIVGFDLSSRRVENGVFSFASLGIV